MLVEVNFLNELQVLRAKSKTAFQGCPLPPQPHLASGGWGTLKHHAPSRFGTHTLTRNSHNKVMGGGESPQGSEKGALVKPIAPPQ